jgi:hypothetical protein
MGPDAANVVASLARSLEVERCAGVTQRASDFSQGQISEASEAEIERERAAAANQLRREKIRQDRERRRRESERKNERELNGCNEPDESLLDVVV